MILGAVFMFAFVCAGLAVFPAQIVYRLWGGKDWVELAVMATQGTVAVAMMATMPATSLFYDIPWVMLLAFGWGYVMIHRLLTPRVRALALQPLRQGSARAARDERGFVHAERPRSMKKRMKRAAAGGRVGAGLGTAPAAGMAFTVPPLDSVWVSVEEDEE